MPWVHFLWVSVTQNDQTDTLFPFGQSRSQLNHRLEHASIVFKCPPINTESPRWGTAAQTWQAVVGP